jgi:hypothetical protein
MWLSTKSPSYDIRTNPFKELQSGAEICAFTYSRGGEKALRETIENGDKRSISSLCAR